MNNKTNIDFYKVNKVTSSKNVIMIAILGICIGVEFSTIYNSIAYGTGEITDSAFILAGAVVWMGFELRKIFKRKANYLDMVTRDEN